MPNLLLVVQYLTECQIWFKKSETTEDLQYGGFDVELYMTLASQKLTVKFGRSV